MGITQELIVTGTISGAAVDDLSERLLKPAVGRAEGTWEKSWFQLAHFCTLYLPLRYAAWARQIHRNEETEQKLWRLAREAEQALWNGALVCVPDNGLREMVFGGEDPTGRLLADLEIPPTWFVRYREKTEGLSEEWASVQHWPCWSALAIHYSSCCLNWLQQRSIPDVEFDESLLHAEAVAVLCSRIGDHLGNDAVATAMRAWLHGQAAPRTSDGSPSFGRPRTAFIGESIRTSSEMLLIRGYQEP
jgi:hypothetical protein